jgi:hypothetical protein
MAINLNGTTPAAPAGSTNVTWQEDVSGNVSAYVSTGPTTLTPVDLTAQTANIGATTLLAATASARYLISGYIIVTTVDGVSSTMPKITITWTDPDNSAAQSFDLTATSAGNTTATIKQGVMVVSAKTATNIQYATSGYVSNTPATMQYALHLTIQKL